MTRVVEEDETPVSGNDPPVAAAEESTAPDKTKHVSRRKSFVASVFRRTSKMRDV
jgi:hypothetical protein